MMYSCKRWKAFLSSAMSVSAVPGPASSYIRNHDPFEVRVKLAEDLYIQESIDEGERQVRLKGAIETFNKIVKTVVLAWASVVVDDTMRRFAMIELD